MDAKSVLINALGTYLIVDIPDLKGDTTSRVNAVLRCNEYLLHNTVTTDWVKRNWVIMSPAVKCYRKSLVADIHHARIIENEEALAKLYAEYDILAPYIQLFKEFPKFLK